MLPETTSVLDREALRDRLFADAVAAPLRDSALFRGADMLARRAQTERYVLGRSAVHRDDLGGTEADSEWAKNEALALWQTCLSKEQNTDRVVQTLSTVAARLLFSAGPDVALRVVHEEPGREILRWRFVSLAVPPSTLIAALAAQNGVRSPSSVRLLDRSFAPDQAVAELHVHHAAMMSFEALWAGAGFTVLTDPDAFFRSVQSSRAICPELHSGLCATAGRPERVHIEHMGAWADVVRQAFIARRVMQRHLWHEPKDLGNCGHCRPGLVPMLHNFVRGRLRRHAHGVTPHPWPDDLVEMLRDRRAADATIRRPTLGDFPRYWHDEETKRERALLRSAFKYLAPREDACRDPVFETLFVQYLRIKTAVFRLLVHPPGERGLKKFLDHFTQIKVYSSDADKIPLRAPVEEGLTVCAVEYRVAPDAWLSNRNRGEFPLKQGNRARRLGAPSTAVSGCDAIESAWLIHFKRHKYDDGLPLFGSVVHSLEIDADKIIKAFRFDPRLMGSFRGLDLCGVEDDQPLWVVAQTLRRVRVASSDVLARRPSSTIKPLRLTLHAGEDFSWLTSGIRAVAEPFVWKLLQRGDRVGHGIGLTMTPVDWWSRRAGRVIQISRFNRFLDLAFVALYTPGRAIREDRWLRASISQVAEAIWPNDLVSPSDDVIAAAIEFWKTLGSDAPRRFAKLPRKPLRQRRSDSWLYSYLWDRSTRKHAHAEVSLSIENDRTMAGKSDWIECELLTVAREKLIREVAAWQVCIESNPTSNLVVGSLDAIAAQDFLQRRPTLAAGDDKETLTWTIGTDDPITFSTTLADEYAYAWAGMVLRKKDPYDPAYARALLDEAAATSMRMRFTIPNDHDDQKRRNQYRSYDPTRRD